MKLSLDFQRIRKEFKSQYGLVILFDFIYIFPKHSWASIKHIENWHFRKNKFLLGNSNPQEKYHVVLLLFRGLKYIVVTELLLPANSVHETFTSTYRSCLYQCQRFLCLFCTILSQGFYIDR